MKTIWIAAVLLTVVVVGSIALFFYTGALYTGLQENLERLYRAVEGEDWAEAGQQSGRLQKIWAQTDAAWTPIMDHHQVDRLDESLTRVFKLVELRNREELLLELTLAGRMAQRVKDSEVPMLRNIF
ncbi:MAG: DUF4363 family protein [Firmicutes bacterium]|nr:DUF4363 family protein [Bacillota bacterium]